MVKEIDEATQRTRDEWVQAGLRELTAEMDTASIRRLRSGERLLPVEGGGFALVYIVDANGKIVDEHGNLLDHEGNPTGHRGTFTADKDTSGS